MVKNKLVKAILFLVILGLVNLLVIHIYSKIMVSSVEFVRDAQFEKIDKKNSFILALGDSHPGWAIENVYFQKKMVKWVSPGEGYIQNYYKLKYYLSRYPIHCVILPVDLHSFSSSNILNIRNDFYWVKYINYFELGAIAGDFRGYFMRYLKGSFFPYVGESDTIYQWLVKKYFSDSADKSSLPVARGPHFYVNIPISYGGLGMGGKKKKRVKPRIIQKTPPVSAKRNWSLVEEADRVTKASVRVRSQFGKQYDYFDPVMVKYFQKILTLCNEKGVVVFLVKFPISSEYYNSASQIFPIDQFYEKIGGMVTLRRNSCILDYQKEFFYRPDLLADPDHINHIGTAIISKKISAEINAFFFSHSDVK